MTNSNMLNSIIKKLTSSNVSKAKLQAIADILGIKSKKTTKSVDDAYLQKIKQDHENDKIELDKDIALLKSLPQKVPKPTTKKPAIPTPAEKPKEQLTWLEHVKKYAKDHKLSYREALKAAKSTYVKKSKAAPKKKEKKEKKVTEHQCKFCEYKSTDKSNFNRHMKKHLNREKLLLELMGARGAIRTHRVRAEKSKNKDVREESMKILNEALNTEKRALGLLKMLENGKPSTSTTKTVVKKASKDTNKVPKYAEELITRLNKSYADNSGEKLGLTKDKITEFNRNGNNITMKVKGLVVDDGEHISSIELVYDNKMDGYEVTLMQDEDVKGEIKSLEYDDFYAY